MVSPHCSYMLKDQEVGWYALQKYSNPPTLLKVYKALIRPHLEYAGVVWGVSNHWNGIWNGTTEWKMEWNGECT